MPPRKVVTGRSQEPRRRYAEELRRLRLAKGLTLRELAALVGWDASLFGKLETGSTLGSPDVAEALDQFYGTPGLLLAMWEMALGDPTQFREKYRRYMALEAEAVSLWHYGASAVPGLLQTAGYAREALAAGWIKDDELDQQVEARLGRRKLLEGDSLPCSGSSSPRQCCALPCVTRRRGGSSCNIWRRLPSAPTSPSRSCRSVPVPTV